MKNKIIFSILFVFTLIIAISCEKADKWKDFQTFDPANLPITGQYHVSWYLNGAVQGKPTILSLYASPNKDGVWVDDNKEFWSFKVKANFNGNTFSITKGVELLYDDSTTIKNGAVTNDSIYMEVEWVSDAGNTYVCRGKRQTGFE